LIRKPAVAVVAILALAGCSGSSSKTSTPPTVTPTIPPISSTTFVSPKIDPCRLLTAQDAAKLTGRTMKRALVSGSGAIICTYAAGTSAGAEITVKFDPTGLAAHDEFPSWVQPIPGVAVGRTTTSVPGVGSEATESRTQQVNDGIYVRQDATLIKIGAFPAVSDAALRAAAKTALARLPAPR
jgi:hypothetical protein